MAFDSRIRNPLAPRRDSRVSVPQAEKITLPGVSGSVSGLCRVTATVRTRSETNPFSRKYRTDVAAARFRNQDRIPFRLNRGCFFLLRVRVTERERTASTARDRTLRQTTSTADSRVATDSARSTRSPPLSPRPPKQRDFTRTSHPSLSRVSPAP